VLGLSPEQEAAVRRSRSLNAALRIMEHVQRPEGATVEELLDALQIRAGTFHPRLYELIHTGCLYVDGRRKTRTGHLARVYKLSKNATFAQYVELRRITYSKHAAHADLTDIQRAVLAAGMKTLNAWSGSAQQRRNAVVAFVRSMNDISKLKKRAEHREADQEQVQTEPQNARRKGR